MQTPDHEGQWGLHNPGAYDAAYPEDIDINAPEGWDIQPYATEKIGVIDSGIDVDHPDLASKIDFSLSKCFQDVPCTIDIGTGEAYHGAQTAGILGAVMDNATGVAGLTGAATARTLVVLKVESRSGYPEWAEMLQVAKAISYAADLGIPILNLSLGYDRRINQPEGHALRDATRNAHQLGLLVCAGGGNGPHSYFVPASFDRFAFGVGGINAKGQHPVIMPDSIPFATGPWIDVVAPGPASSPPHDLFYWSTTVGGYGTFAGTSGATPHVAGAASLILTHTPSATNEDMVELIARRARDYGDAGYDETFGFGLVRLDSTLCWLEERTLAHGSAKGWTSYNEVGVGRSQQFKNLPGDPPNEWMPYWAHVYEFRRWAPFPSNPPGGAMDSTTVWARGRQCSGWRDTTDVDVLSDASWARVVPSTVSSLGCELYSYFYELYTDPAETTFVGWFPVDPFADPGLSEILWRYTYLHEAGQFIDSGTDASSLSYRGAASSSGSTGPSPRFQVVLPRRSPLWLEVFDVRGRRVCTWEVGELSAGRHEIPWDRRDQTGSLVAPGVYFGRLRSTDTLSMQRLVVLR